MGSGLASPQDDVEDDGGAQDGCDGVERNDRGGWQGAEEVAEECQDGTSEHRDGQEHTVVGGAQQEESHMRSCQSEEGNGATIGSDDSGEQTRGKKQEVACALDVDAKIGGIGFAEHDGIQGFHEQEGEKESQNAQRGEDGHLLHGDAVEVAHAPNEETLDVLNRGEEVEQRNQRGGDIPHHDTRDEQHEVVFQQGGEEEQQAHDEQTAQERRTHDGKIAAPGVEPCRDGAAKGKHHNRHTQVGT